MSDTVYQFIPTNPEAVMTSFVSDIEKLLVSMGTDFEIETDEKIQFANAGENFESVWCPFCNAELMEWWGNSMNESYSVSDGFVDLVKMTPCCKKQVNLNDLNYCLPQGFYRTIIKVKEINESNTNQILKLLFEQTQVEWKVVIQRI